jgi:serine phosphatase RsbU (regulator of sigma subunit)
VDDRDPLIEGLADQVAGEQARLARILDRLPAAAGTADTAEVRAAVTEIARDVCDAPLALFVGIDDEDDEATLVAPGQEPVRPPDPREAPMLSAAFTTGDVLVVEDVQRATTGGVPAAYGSLGDGRPLRCWLAAPVVHPGTKGGAGPRRLGVLFVGHTRAHAFDARHHHQVGAVARFLASALDSALTVDEHVRTAEGLQEALLPPLIPRIDGADIASRYRPAGEASLIGGDFYDVFPSTDGRWVVAIGDVCGVGPEAAAVTGIARYTLRAVGREDPRPGHALAALNDAILQATPDNRFCTAVSLCVEQVAAGVTIRWSNAGHPPPLVLRDDGRVEILDERLGPLLGVLDGAEYKEAGVSLRGGDALVLYTDGVIEARRGAGEFFGEARLAEVVASCAGRTADGIARRVELAVIDHLGGLPDDDVAILVLRATPPAIG